VCETREVKAEDLTIANGGNAETREIVDQRTIRFPGGQAIFPLRASSSVARALRAAEDENEAFRRMAEFAVARKLWEQRISRVRPAVGVGRRWLYTLAPGAPPDVKAFDDELDARGPGRTRITRASKGEDSSKCLRSPRAMTSRSGAATADRKASFRLAAPPPPLRAVGGRSPIAGGGSRGGRYYS
jgi:hypothetical protein